MSTQSWKAAPVLSVTAATAIALACGTNYGYSAWAPSFADRMKLSSTQQNLIGTWGNLGQYATGIPAGMLVDSRGPRWSILFGSIGMGVGYYFCYKAALNFPSHRGTATAFPLAAFGLSAFFFSSISSLAFPDNTADLLLLLAALTFCLPFFGNFLLRVPVEKPSYAALNGSDDREDAFSGTRLSPYKMTTRHAQQSKADLGTPPVDDADVESLLSEFSDDGFDENKLRQLQPSDSNEVDSPLPDTRGLQMLRYPKFYQLWGFLGLMTGIGLMTINNIGGDVRALVHGSDRAATAESVQQRQLNQVELLSVMSFVGRLLSGIGSDVLVRQFQLSRFWCPVISALLFILAQLSAVLVTQPQHLFLVSGLSGLAYGFLFGCYPALVAETFGINGMTQNWGFMTLSVVPGAHLFNFFYGTIYDAHSEVKKDGTRACLAGIDCYRSAYIITLAAAGIGLLWSLVGVRYDWMKRQSGRPQRNGSRQA